MGRQKVGDSILANRKHDGQVMLELRYEHDVMNRKMAIQASWPVC